jgi:hypothetical protein
MARKSTTGCHEGGNQVEHSIFPEAPIQFMIVSVIYLTKEKWRLVLVCIRQQAMERPFEDQHPVWLGLPKK